MNIVIPLVIIVVSYLLGSIPFGYLVVKVFNGRDVRFIASGRTGGTNAMRAAGLLAGLVTALLDVLKAYSTGLLVLWLAPGQIWLQVFAPVMAVVGHNYSVFLTEIDQGGKLIFRGGAGGAPALGGAIALWFPSWFIILPFAILVYLFVGYASITTISIAFSTTALFVVLVIQGLVPWQYIIYGVLALFAVTIALQPNLIALAKGSERMVGLRAYFSKRKLDRNPKQTP